MNRINIINISKKIIAAVILIMTCLLVFQIDIKKDWLKSATNNTFLADQWNGNQDNVHEIINIDNLPSVIQYVYFSDFINNLSTFKNQDINSFIIVIESPLDFQYISMLMNDIPTGLSLSELIAPSWYLSLNYVLGRNLTFSGEIIYPIGNRINMFTGVFDGQGFALIDLFITQLDSEKYEYYQNDTGDLLEYYALFSYIGEGAIVKNIRMIDPFAAQVYTINNAIVQAAPLAGYNSGIIANCSVISLNPLGKEFTIHSEIILSTMVSHNTATGIIKNSFTGVINDIFTAELEGNFNTPYPVIYQNDAGGQLINVYCDMERFIPEVSEINPNIIEIYHTEDFQNPLTFATEFVNNWYFNNSYSDVVLNELYPALIGLRLYENSIDTYEISKPTDLLAFSQLVDLYPLMANRNYILTNCIDMKAIAKNLYVAPKVAFNGVFTSEKLTSNPLCNHNHELSNAIDKYHSIWNLTINKASNGDTTSYALINQLGGTIKNINLVNYQCIMADATSYTTNIIHTGSVVGKVLSGALFDNVNVYGTIALPNNKIYGEIYIGGLVGLNCGNIMNSTFNGQINGGIQNNDGVIRTNNGIGGIAGKSDNGTFLNVKNTGRLIGISFIGTNANTNTQTTTYLGGIVGFGSYTSLKKVVNTGMIISSDPTGYLPNTYVGGIISKLTNVSAITENTYNSGEIRILVKDSNAIRNYFASGFGTISTNSTNQIKLFNITNNGKVQLATSFVYASGKYTFNENFYNYSTIMTSSGNTTVNPEGNTNIGGAIKLTGTIIIDRNTACELNGIYQNQNQTIDLGILYRYAPVIYSLNESTNYIINVNKAYNTGNLTFVTTRPMYNAKVQITGNTYGDYIYFNYLRNEGNLTFDINYPSTNTFKTSGTLTDYSSNFRVSGLVGTINNYSTTEGYYIYNSYNGGNITVKNWNSNKTQLMSGISVTTKTNTLQYMLYIGGIAFKNNNTRNIEAKEKIIIAATRKGGIHNCLNNGDIYVDVNLFGCSRLGGITSLNGGLISSSFNTGNIYNYTALYIVPSSEDMDGNQFEVEAGGITCMITADTGQIMDCANYGDIMCVSPIGKVANSGNGWLNAAGIVGRNEKAENNRGNATGNWRGKVEFCANYGNIYAWNAYDEAFGDYLNGTSDTEYIGAESSCKAAGIIAIGVINVINCANYGNIYSRYLSGGIFGLVDGTKFKDITTSVYIANSINYGEVRRISVFNKSQSPFRSQFTTTTTVPTARTVRIGTTDQTLNSMYGGAMGYIYAHSQWSRDGIPPSTNASYLWTESQVIMLTYLKISFLINFDDQTNIIGSQSICTQDLGTKYAPMVQYMATTKPTDTSMYPFNSNKAGAVYYVPSYSLSTDTGGIFNTNFPLRAGNLDLNIETNKYIRNYINFVEYEYTNTNLVNKLFSTDKRIGIYALASSKGILNGKYIPDNINWGNADEPGLDPIVNEEADANWRGDIDNTNSINYKFKKGMKQLANSIATTVYDLELMDIDNSNNIIDAPVVDNTNKIITFYIGDNEGKEASETLFGKTTAINPVVDEDNKTIEYYDSNNELVISYSYSSGSLVRTDNNNTIARFNPQETQTVTCYKKIDSYTAGNISSYYIYDNGLYRAAQNSDRLYKLTVDTSYIRRYYISNGNYLYTSSTYSATHRITAANEVTNRINPTGPFYYRQPSSNASYPNYYLVGNTIPENYVLYEKVLIAYPTKVDIYQMDSYYDNWFTVNIDNGSYLLAEGAKLELTGDNAANNIRICVPAIVDGPYTSSINNASTTNYLYVKSEAGTYATYEIRIKRMASKNLLDTKVIVQGGSTYISSEGSIILRDGTVDVSLNKTSTQTLDISFKTINMPDKQDLLINTKFKKFNELTSTYEDYNNTTLNQDIYRITGGSVVNKSDMDNEMTGEKESALIREDGTFPDANVAFQLVFGELIAAGTYQLQISIGDNIYYVQFKVSKSSAGLVEELTYDDNFTVSSGTWINTQNHAELLTTVLYDSNVRNQLSLMANMLTCTWDNIILPNGSYISDLKISPYAKITSVTYQETLARSNANLLNTLGGDDYTNDDNNSRLYIITYNIQAEDGTMKTFKHYIVEKLIDTNVQYVYMDGINQGQINNLSFVRTNKPVVKVFYVFQNIDTSNVGNFQAKITYDYDTAKYPKQPNDDDNELILASISNVQGNLNGITISFLNDVACQYSVTVTYTRTGEEIPAITFQEFTINKTNNTDSSLVRILFSTESPFTTLGTIVYNGHQISTPGDINYVPETTATSNQTLLTTSIFDILNSDSSLRVIKSMPNLIYYNDATPRILNDNNGNIYNRYDVIGFVSKTDLTNYQPSFTLPTGAVIYQLDENNNPLVDENNKLILSANYINEDGSDDFDYVHYRIYSEASSVDDNGFCIPNENNDNYTDYYVYVLDVSYNVYFDIIFNFANEEISNELANGEEKTLLSLLRYEEIEEDGTSYPANDISIISNVFYFFTYEDNQAVVKCYNHNLAATSAGYFKLELTLPKGMTYSFTFSGDDEIINHTMEDYFHVESKIFAYRYALTLTIDRALAGGDWGQNGTVELKDIYN